MVDISTIIHVNGVGFDRIALAQRHTAWKEKGQKGGDKELLIQGGHVVTQAARQQQSC